MGAPVGDLNAVQSLDGPSERYVDRGDSLARSTQMGPERRDRKSIRVHPPFQVVRPGLELQVRQHAVGGRRRAREKGWPDPAFQDREGGGDRSRYSGSHELGDRREVALTRPRAHQLAVSRVDTDK